MSKDRIILENPEWPGSALGVADEFDSDGELEVAIGDPNDSDGRVTYLSKAQTEKLRDHLDRVLGPRHVTR